MNLDPTKQFRGIQNRLLEKTKTTPEIVSKINNFYKEKGEPGVNPQDIIKATTSILANYEYTNEKYPSEVRRLILDEVNKLNPEERVYTLGRLLDIFLYSSLVEK